MTLRTVFLRSFPLALLLTGLMAAVSQANLLTDPGFESGGLTNWTTYNAGWYVNTWDQHSGGYAVVDNVEPTDPDEWHVVHQTVAASAGQAYSISAWLKTVNIDTTAGWLEVQFLDSSKNNILWQAQSTHVTSDAAYQQLTINDLVAPVGTAFIDVRGVADRVSPPSHTNYICFDDFSLTAVPEPASITMVLSGLIGLIVYAWRKRR